MAATHNVVWCLAELPWCCPIYTILSAHFFTEAPAADGEVTATAAHQHHKSTVFHWSLLYMQGIPGKQTRFLRTALCWGTRVRKQHLGSGPVYYKVEKHWHNSDLPQRYPFPCRFPAEALPQRPPLDGVPRFHPYEIWLPVCSSPAVLCLPSCSHPIPWHSESAGDAAELLERKTELKDYSGH